MLMLAVVIASIAVAAIVLIAASAQLTDIPGIHNRIKNNFRLLQLVVVVIACGLLPLGVTSLASSAGKDNVVNGYKEFINGALVSADVSVTRCGEDGSCSHYYQCHKYYVTVVDQAAYTDSNGDYHSEQSHIEKRYHHCPYVSDEYSYSVTDSLGDQTWIKNNWFALNPVKWSGSDQSIPTNVPRGVPAEWLKYKRHIAARKADGVTKIISYPNYILASNDTLEKTFSADIDEFLGKKLLPDHTANFLHGDPIHDRWVADKASFVGLQPTNEAAWQTALMRLNAVLGMNLQGDLHFVAINDSLVPAGESERYANALIAYWQGPHFRKKAIAKNGIVAIAGVKDGVITWARAKTGMPVGNGPMLNAITAELPGTALTPETVLGNLGVTGMFKNKDGKKRLSYRPSQGVLEKILLREYPFARPCMGCTDKSEKGTSSFVYLKASIKTPAWAYWLAGFLALLCGVAGGFGILFLTPDFQAYLNGTQS